MFKECQILNAFTNPWNTSNTTLNSRKYSKPPENTLDTFENALKQPESTPQTHPHRTSSPPQVALYLVICAPVLSTDIMRLDGVTLPWQGWITGIGPRGWARASATRGQLGRVASGRCGPVFDGVRGSSWCICV